ncbi:MAG: hypothetical protein IPQ18_05445 [Saprospiraceae bacterium]|jgi:hypothetical protein|nr:hypothetical protein [Saprospiraceae bacterium]MBL0293095.1 hypothetical protein [Saprospiraceae bacterium]
MKGNNFSLSSVKKRLEKLSILTLVVFGFSFFAFSGQMSAQDRTGGANLKTGQAAIEAASVYSQAISSTMPNDVIYSLPLESRGNPDQIATVTIANEFITNLQNGTVNSTTAFNNAVNSWISKAPNETKLVLRAANNLLNVIRQ